jgi:outer membrane receptor protein involved in Fe transport
MTASAHTSNGPSTKRAARGLMLTLVLSSAAFANAQAQAQSQGQAPASRLTTLSLEQLLEVTIVGASKYEQKQSEVAAAVSVITRQEMKAFGWRTLGDALASLPGVHTTYDRQYLYLGTRGFGLPGDLNTRVLVTVNGNRINDPTFDQGQVGRDFQIDMDLVERIEFIPGPGGAVYGQNAMFGVVNVVTRGAASLDGAELALAYQSPQSLRAGRASWGKVLDNGIRAVVSVGGVQARGEDRFFEFGKSGLSGVAAGLDGERVRELFTHVSSGAWSFDLVHGYRRKDDPTGGFLSDPLVPGQFQADRTTTAQLQYQDSFSAGTLDMVARLFMGRQRFTSVQSYTTPFGNPAASDWRGAEVRLLSKATADHKTMVGMELQDNFRTDQAVYDIAHPANNIFIPGSGYRVGLYAQDEWRMADSLSATLGLRFDRNSFTGNKLSPRAALIWSPSPATTLKALYGRAHRAPNVFERDHGDGISQAANLQLKGESIDTLELVADHRVGGDLTLRGSLYQWKMQNIVTLGMDPVTGLSQYQSGDVVTARGVEMSGDKTWGWGARLRGSLSFQNVAQAGGPALPNVPKLLGKVNLSAPLPFMGWRAGYEFRYDGKRLSLDGTRLGGYAVSNLHLSTDALARGLELSLGIRNLFDKRYAHPAADTNWQNALEQDGRSVQAKMTYRF